MKVAERDTLAREHVYLVDKIAASMGVRFAPHADRDELRSFGMVGLASAIDNWDPERGVPFGAYATSRIRGAVYDGIREATWFPRRLARQISFYRRADDMLRAATDEPPPADAVEATHRLADRLGELAAAYVTTWAAETPAEDPGDPPDAEDLVGRKQISDRLRAMIDVLPGRQRDVLGLYFYEDLSLSQVAARLGVNKSWACRLLSAGLSQLREDFSEAGATPEDYPLRG